MSKFRALILYVFALALIQPLPTRADDYAACAVAGVVKPCPAGVRLKAGQLVNTAYIPWAAAPNATIPNAALVTQPPALSSTTPANLGPAAVGTGTTSARADHVHPPAYRLTCGSAAVAPGSPGYMLAPGTTLVIGAGQGAAAIVGNNCTVKNLSCMQGFGTSTPAITIDHSAAGAADAGTTGVTCTLAASNACTDTTHTYATSGDTALYCKAVGATATATNVVCSFDCN